VNDRGLNNLLDILIRVGAVAKDGRSSYVIGDPSVVAELASRSGPQTEKFNGQIVEDFKKALSEIGYEFN
jgi:hypothetical protein